MASWRKGRQVCEPQLSGILTLIWSGVGFGILVQDVATVCILPGICFDVDFDLLFADKDVVGQCDPLKAAYEMLPEGNALVVRASAKNAQGLGGLLSLFGIEPGASVRVALSAEKLAFVSQVTVSIRMFGMDASATLAAGNYPTPFFLASATVCIHVWVTGHLCSLRLHIVSV